ncbi:MAG TPA: hypothetical protein PKI41_15375 [Candidatus Competibacteraceae bacterium]|nr:hypothetical protein [Candidatus Competibacteraceae bacterium]
MKIGIDFGGVIVQASKGEDFNPELAEVIAVPESIKTIAELAKEHEIFIVSKASRRVQAFTRQWLATVNFYQKTSFNPSNLLFCEKRSEKAIICKENAIEWFVDDSSEVISSLSGIVPNTILFNGSLTWVAILHEIQSKKIL